MSRQQSIDVLYRANDWASYIDAAKEEERAEREERLEAVATDYPRARPRRLAAKCDCLSKAKPRKPEPQEDERELTRQLHQAMGMALPAAKCKCEPPLAVVEWNGRRVPLEAWCFKCGHVLPRPKDRRFPLPSADRARAIPTVETAMIAEPVS